MAKPGSINKRQTFEALNHTPINDDLISHAKTISRLIQFTTRLSKELLAHLDPVYGQICHCRLMSVAIAMILISINCQNWGRNITRTIKFWEPIHYSQIYWIRSNSRWLEIFRRLWDLIIHPLSQRNREKLIGHQILHLLVWGVKWVFEISWDGCQQSVGDRQWNQWLQLLLI